MARSIILASMKKIIIVLFLFAFACADFWADSTSRFYRNGELLDTMFVNSPEGLKIRDGEGLKSVRIAGVDHRMPLKIIRLGKTETIDGISAPWVKVLIPRYSWASAGTRFGWVFGGYLQENRPALSTTGWTASDLANYLGKYRWREYDADSEPGYIFSFDNEQGSFWRGKAGSGIGEGGTWKAISRNEVSFHTTFVMEDEEDERWNLKFTFYPDGSFSHGEYRLYIDFAYILEEGLQDTPEYYELSMNGCNFLEWVATTEWIRDKDELIREAIEAGISAEKTKADEDELYHQYWKDRENPSWK